MDYITPMFSGWYRMRDAHVLVPKIRGKPFGQESELARHVRMEEKRARIQEEREAREEAREKRAVERARRERTERPMGSSQRVPDTLPTLPRGVRSLAFRAMTHIGQPTANVKKGESGLTTEELTELKSYDVVRYAQGSSQWLVIPPYAIVARKHRSGEISEADVKRLLGLDKAPDDMPTPPPPMPTPEPDDAPQPEPPAPPTDTEPEDEEEPAVATSVEPEKQSASSGSAPSITIEFADGDTETIGPRLAGVLIAKDAEAEIEINATEMLIVITLEDSTTIKVPIAH
jgi:hypothetical protein